MDNIKRDALKYHVSTGRMYFNWSKPGLLVGTETPGQPINNCFVFYIQVAPTHSLTYHLLSEVLLSKFSLICDGHIPSSPSGLSGSIVTMLLFFQLNQ